MRFGEFDQDLIYGPGGLPDPWAGALTSLSDMSPVPTLNVAPPKTGGAKPQDYLRSRADLMDAEEKLRQLHSKRDEALQKVIDKYGEIGQFSPARVPEARHIGAKEAAIAGGLSVLGRLFGGERAAPGIREGLASYLGNRQKTMDEARDTLYKNNQANAEALKARLTAGLQASQLGFQSAQGDLQYGERAYDQAVQKDLDRQNRLTVADQREEQAKRMSPTHQKMMIEQNLADGLIDFPTYTRKMNALGVDVNRPANTASITRQRDQRTAYAAADRPMKVRQLAAYVGIAENNKVLGDLKVENYDLDQAVKLLNPLLSAQNMALQVQAMINAQRQFNATKDYDAWKVKLDDLTKEKEKMDTAVQGLREDYAKAKAEAASNEAMANDPENAEFRSHYMSKAMEARNLFTNLEKEIRRIEGNSDTFSRTIEMLKAKRPGTPDIVVPQIKGLQELLDAAKGMRPKAKAP